LIVVVNELLMDNHQQELADALAENKYLVIATPSNILDKLSNFDRNCLVEYPKADAGNLALAIDRRMGYAP
jgi:beta-1,4-N-acetylglucosaminyltransferase